MSDTNDTNDIGTTSTAPDVRRAPMSRRTALGYGAVTAGVAGVAASQLVAGPASAAVPAATKAATGSLEARTISRAQAEALVRAAVRYVEKTAGIPPMYVLVVDAAGEVKASTRMDGNGPASVALVPPKAATARAFRTATADLAARTTDPARIASFVAAGYSLLGGGRPVVENGQVIGAIGVGGGSPEQDDQVAQAALRAQR
jgi:uncharacterized protein GlcG (DUF336 family)